MMGVEYKTLAGAGGWAGLRVGAMTANLRSRC